MRVEGPRRRAYASVRVNLRECACECMRMCVRGGSTSSVNPQAAEGSLKQKAKSEALACLPALSCACCSLVGARATAHVLLLLRLQQVSFRKVVQKMANTSSAMWTPLPDTFGWELLFHAAMGGVQVHLTAVLSRTAGGGSAGPAPLETSASELACA